jgi:hypothetical protein
MQEKEYISSKDAKAILKVQDCDLMHIRTSGKLKFVKKGNAFLYSKDSILRFMIVDSKPRFPDESTQGR